MNKNTKAQFHDKGLKATPARLAILSVFSVKCHPLNAEQVHKKIGKKAIDLVTVYRTLASFEADGILKKVDLRKESLYYELATEQHHHHLVCKECGIIEEFTACDIDILSKKII